MSDLGTILADRIKYFAKRRGVSLTHLAMLPGRSRSHFWDVLAGNKSPSVKWLESLAEDLDVEVWQLLKPPRRT